MKVYSYEAPATVGILLMFVASGFSKFTSKTQSFDIERTQKFFRNLYISLPRSLILFSVILVGIFEIVTSGIILHDVFIDESSKNRLSSKSKLATKALIAFTVLVTFMFYLFKWRPLLSNISTISGLLFLYQIIIRNTLQNESPIPNQTIKRVEKLMKQSNKTIQPELSNGNLQMGSFCS